MLNFGRFGGRRSAAHDNTPTNDYGTPAGRSHPAHRPAILANHWLHWISSLIVLGISANFIHDYKNDTHLVYWLTIAVIDVLVYLPGLFLPTVRSYKGYLAPATWLFSYLWLTAFIFAAQDYNFNGGRLSPSGVSKLGLKRTLEAFAFLAFFTSLVGQFLEGWLWARQPFKSTSRHGAHADKNMESTSTASTAPPMAGPTDGMAPIGGMAPVHDHTTGASAV